MYRIGMGKLTILFASFLSSCTLLKALEMLDRIANGHEYLQESIKAIYDRKERCLIGSSTGNTI